MSSEPVPDLNSRELCSAAARLIQRIVPETDALAFFDDRGRLVALSEDCTTGAFLDLMDSALESRKPVRDARSRASRDDTRGERVYALPLPAQRGTKLRRSGVLALRCVPGAAGQLPPVEDLQTTLAPLLRQFASLGAAPAHDIVTPAARGPLSRPQVQRAQQLLRLVRVHLGADAAALRVDGDTRRIMDWHAGSAGEQALLALRMPERSAESLVCQIYDDGGQRIGQLTLLRGSQHASFSDLEAQAAREAALEFGSVLRDDAPDVATPLLAHATFEALARAASVGATTAAGALLVVTLENLDVIRETLGELSGRTAVDWVAQRLRAPQLPAAAIATRCAPDQFAIHLPASVKIDAHAVARRIRREVSGLRLGYPPIALQLSVGVAECAARQTFDRALQIAQSDSHDSTVVLELPDLDRRPRARAVLSAPEVRDILANDRLRLYAQSIESSADSPRQRFEVLLRVEAPGGIVESPAALLDAAKQGGMLSEVDRWVVERSLGVLRHWHRSGAIAAPEMSINLTEESIVDPQFAEFLETTITQSGVPANWLSFETDHDVAVRHGDMLADLFRRLRRLGCGRTLDDFDCASGEHARLGDLAVSTLNVDATLVVTGRFDVNSIVAAATTGGLPTACGIEVRAKRVESDELCAQMKRAGAHSLQGYAVARPRPLRALLADLASA